MWRHGQLLAADPELQQARINVHQRRASKVREQAGADGVVKIQQQVSPFKNGLGFRPAHVQIIRRRFRRGCIAPREVENVLAAEAMLVHAPAKRGQRLGFLFRTAHGAKAFQPIHVATELTQPEHVLEVNPKMPTPFREGRHVVRRNDDGGHVVKRVNSPHLTSSSSPRLCQGHDN